MLPLSRLGCPLSLKTPNMGNPGLMVEGEVVLFIGLILALLPWVVTLLFLMVVIAIPQSIWDR